MIGEYLQFHLHLLKLLMYKFDYTLEAVSAKKERYVWLVFMGIVFFVLYGFANELADLTSPHPSYFMEWEKSIPFVEVFIVPYMSSDLMFIVAFLLPYTRIELRILAARVLFIVTISSLIFVLFPLQFAFDKPEILYFHALFGALQADLPYNQLPSLHISFAIVLWYSMKKYILNKYLKVFTLFWFLLITVSTLFVYQHHFIDIPTGAMMGFIAVKLISKDSSFIKHFTTPRSLKMGLYFLGGAVFFMLVSFNIDIFKWLFLYIFISLFSISVIYAFGLNTFLVGKNSNASIFQRVLFFPYFLGSYLSWVFYKQKIPLKAFVKS